MSDGLTIISLCPTIVKRYGLRAGISLAAFIGTGAVVMLCGTMAPITGLKPVGPAMFKEKDGIVRSCQAVFCCALVSLSVSLGFPAADAVATPMSRVTATNDMHLLMTTPFDVLTSPWAENAISYSSVSLQIGHKQHRSCGGLPRKRGCQN